MTFWGLLIVLAFCGFLSWILLQIPMPVVIRNIILGVIAFAIIIFVLQFFGVHTGLSTLKVG